MSTTRKIKIWSTEGENGRIIETDLATWGELKELLISEGYNIPALHATESITRTDLVNDMAALPSQNFNLFLRPKETKSGSSNKAVIQALSYKELRQQVANLKSILPVSDFKKIFGNYTIDKRRVLEQKVLKGLKEYEKSLASKTTSSASVKKSSEKVVKKAKPVAKTTIKNTTTISLNIVDKLKNCLTTLKSASASALSEAISILENLDEEEWNSVKEEWKQIKKGF